jgi:hypothetical protein
MQGSCRSSAEGLIQPLPHGLYMNVQPTSTAWLYLITMLLLLLSRFASPTGSAHRRQVSSQVEGHC